MYNRGMVSLRKARKKIILIFDAYDDLATVVFDNTQAAIFIGSPSTATVCNALRNKHPVFGRFSLRVYHESLGIEIGRLAKMRLDEYDRLVADLTDKKEIPNGKIKN